MSSTKRRNARKIALLVKMDAGHHICQTHRHRRTDSARQATAGRILANIQALGRTTKMSSHMKERAIAAINARRARMGRPELTS